MSMRKKIGIDYGHIEPITTRTDRIRYINFKLAALGLPIVRTTTEDLAATGDFIDLFGDIIEDYKEKTRRVDVHAIGIHKRINRFFENYFKDEREVPHTIDRYFSLDHYGLARELSLPVDGDAFHNEHMTSYRIKQGVLHNPKHDRRTTKGSFHIVEGGPRTPFDKKEVPRKTFLHLYRAALEAPSELRGLPFTAEQDEKAETFVALMLKPIVSPAVPGLLDEKTMEILFIAPGGFVANLDFVESVFGNAGDPSLHTNDAGLDVMGWSGHTGYIVLAPHLTTLKKIDLGLPSYEEATERQRRDGMCYRDPEDLYNDGISFKLTCRDEKGVVVTLIADSYFGYSKKEVKTQISYAANLFGNAEEEHAGGTIAFPQKNLGENYNAVEGERLEGYTFDEVVANHGSRMYLKEAGYGIDKTFDHLLYLPENVRVDLHGTLIEWEHHGETRALKLRPDYVYILPNGEKFHIEKHPEAPAWKLVGTAAEGTFCHKPCTVSGGGKSEISKSVSNAIIYGTYYVHDLEKDLDYVDRILHYDYRGRWRACPDRTTPSRSILSIDRSLGSVIKLLSPSSAYTDAFNAYIKAIPNHVKGLVFMVKRFYQQSWGNQWREHFSVDIINGMPGNEINFNGRKIRPSYLRVGFSEDKAWRVFKVRMDFMPSEKVQMEDDISASVVVPARHLGHLDPEYSNESVKFVANCEYRFFQRPDEAIHKGYDLKAEEDLSSSHLFATNFEPLGKEAVGEIKDDIMSYMDYSAPVKDHIEDFLAGDASYCVLSSEPRLIDGVPSKNPRYLENRSDFTDPLKNHVAEMGTRLARKVPADEPVPMPVNAIFAGRRNNPPGEIEGKRIRPLAVYNPIHYQELPELFMDYIASLTGKSPSTTGAGSEGALTKAPFNMLAPVYDLNSALLSYVLGDYEVFTTPAGFIGPKARVDHDISLLMPEIWARLTEAERKAHTLIAEGSFEKLEDFDHLGVRVPASRLGYRMTEVFCYKYLGKIFDEPQAVFTEEILRPEKQSMMDFADGVLNIAEGHKKAALGYFEDGSVDEAIPPIKALLSIMAYGHFEGRGIDAPEIRALFEKDRVLASVWYAKRLANKQQIDIHLMEKKINELETFVENPVNKDLIAAFGYKDRLQQAKDQLAVYRSPAYLDSLVGTIGAAALTIASRID